MRISSRCIRSDTAERTGTGTGTGTRAWGRAGASSLGETRTWLAWKGAKFKGVSVRQALSQGGKKSDEKEAKRRKRQPQSGEKR